MFFWVPFPLKCSWHYHRSSVKSHLMHKFSSSSMKKLSVMLRPVGNEARNCIAFSQAPLFLIYFFLFFKTSYDFPRLLKTSVVFFVVLCHFVDRWISIICFMSLSPISAPRFVCQLLLIQSFLQFKLNPLFLLFLYYVVSKYLNFSWCVSQ